MKIPKTWDIFQHIPNGVFFCYLRGGIGRGKCVYFTARYRRMPFRVEGLL